jgi:ligand-binding sensor domain-containing protein
MKVKISLLFLAVTLALSCSKEDEPESMYASATDQNYVGKIIPDENGYWLVTRSAPSKALDYLSNSINFVDGLIYLTNEKSVVKNSIGYIYDAETTGNTLAASTNNQILNYDRSLQNSVVKTAGTSETYKLMDKDANGKVWVLSNKSIFSLSGDIIAFQNNITAIDFEAAKDGSFWIASSDTVYQVKRLSTIKIPITQITGPSSTVPTIYSLKIDKSDNVWINTSIKLYKYGEKAWSDEKVASFTVDNFKTIPFLDIDSKGNLWMAEKHYQAFTNLHCFDGTSWKSYKLDPHIDTWINDIEAAEPGYIWIATNTGLRKLNIN